MQGSLRESSHVGGGHRHHHVRLHLHTLHRLHLHVHRHKLDEGEGLGPGAHHLGSLHLHLWHLVEHRLLLLLVHVLRSCLHVRSLHGHHLHGLHLLLASANCKLVLRCLHHHHRLLHHRLLHHWLLHHWLHHGLHGRLDDRWEGLGKLCYSLTDCQLLRRFLGNCYLLLGRFVNQFFGHVFCCFRDSGFGQFFLLSACWLSLLLNIFLRFSLGS